MDRPRRRPGGLIWALGLGLAAASPAPVPIAAMRWIAPGADRVRILTRRPPECLIRPQNPDQAYLVDLGRAAFRTPMLLGGQSARAGLSCESCHRNGRDNRDFAFPGISGAVGTADVKNFLFSSHRGNHLNQARVIPDLGGPKGQLKIDQSPQSAALETFTLGLITEEFDGPPPSSSINKGIAAYVRALDPRACRAKLDEPVSLAGDLADVDLAVRTAQAALAHGDPASAIMMLAGARTGLGHVSERYSVGNLADQRQRLRLADHGLADVIKAVRDRDAGVSAQLAAWPVQARALRSSLMRHEPQSLYRADRIARLP